MDCRLRRRALDSRYYAFAILTRAQAGEVKEESTVNYFMAGEEKKLSQPTAVCLSALKPLLILCPCCVYACVFVCVCIPNTRRGGEEINSHLHCNCVCIMCARVIRKAGESLLTGLISVCEHHHHVVN